MSKTLKVLGLVLVLVGFTAVAGADSHQTSPIYIWVSSVTAQPGQGEALVGLLMEDAELYDPLVESGAVLEWGIGMPVVHDGGDSGIRYQWAAFVGWAGADQFMKAFMARMEAMSPDQMKTMADKWNSIVEPGSHSDMINRGIHVGAGGNARPAYIHLTYRSAKPGQGYAAEAFFKKSIAPIYDQLVADGKIINYGLHAPAVQRGQSWTHMGWYTSVGLAARDAVEGAFMAAAAARSEAENKGFMESLMTLAEPEYEQQIIMVVHYKAAGGGQEGEE